MDAYGYMGECTGICSHCMHNAYDSIHMYKCADVAEYGSLRNKGQRLCAPSPGCVGGGHLHSMNPPGYGPAPSCKTELYATHSQTVKLSCFKIHLRYVSCYARSELTRISLHKYDTCTCMYTRCLGIYYVLWYSQAQNRFTMSYKYLLTHIGPQRHSMGS